MKAKMDEREKLRKLRDKHRDLYFEWFGLGREIRDLQMHIRESKPQDRVDREVRENWNLTAQILKKADFISTGKWEDVPNEKRGAILSFHRIRHDIRRAIGNALGIKEEEI